MSVSEIKKSALVIAKEELNAEIQKEAIKKLKTKMKQLHDAEVIVANLKRELADLEKEVEAGIF